MSGRKILVVDDHRVIREVLKVYLSPTRAILLEASDGAQALRIVRTDRPDVVIADMQMPGLSGLELLRTLQQDPKLAAIPVIILTGNTEAATAEECLKAGAREVLRKPVTPAALTAAIDRLTPAVKQTA